MPVKYNNEGMKRFQQKVKDLSERRQVPLPELMPDEFIRKHTKFETLQAFFDASGIDNPEEISGEAFSQFVAGNSSFNNWEEMLKTAGEEYAVRRLRM